MAKIISGILLIFYLVTSSNVTINLHYCCDILVAVAINGDADCGHGNEDGINSIPCCTNDLISIAVENHVYSSVDSNFNPKINLVPLQLLQNSESLLISQDEINNVDTRAGPLRSSSKALYLLHSSFMFYG